MKRIYAIIKFFGHWQRAKAARLEGKIECLEKDKEDLKYLIGLHERTISQQNYLLRLNLEEKKRSLEQAKNKED